MELHLDAIQASTLKEVLDSALGDLRFEIADTDNAGYKSGLRDRERILRSLLAQLPAEVPASRP